MESFFLALHVFTYPRIPKEKLLNVQNLKDFSHWRFYICRDPTCRHIPQALGIHPELQIPLSPLLQTTDLFSIPIYGIQDCSVFTWNFELYKPLYLDQCVVWPIQVVKTSKNFNWKYLSNKSKITFDLDRRFWFSIATQYFPFTHLKDLTNDVVLDFFETTHSRIILEKLVDYLSKNS